MATVQHVYRGAGDPNGVITDAEVGSHYIDDASYGAWLATYVDGGQTYWTYQQDGGVYLSGPGEIRQYSESYFGSEVVLAGVTLSVTGASNNLFANVQMQMQGGDATFVTEEDSLVEVRPIYGGTGRVVLVTPVMQPISPI